MFIKPKANIKQAVNKDTKQSLWKYSGDRNIIYLLLGIILTFLVFSKSLQCGFLNWDDDKQITENQVVKNYNGNFLELYKADKHTSFTLLTYAIDYKVWRKNPLPYHLENVLLHLLNVLLVFIFIRKLFKNGDVALVCALLFAVHPTRVESVVWIAERKDLLFAMFSLFSLILYQDYLKREKILVRNFILLIVIIGLSYFAILSKIQAVTLPVMFFMLDFYSRRKITLISVFEKFVLIFLFFLFFPEYVHSYKQILPILSVFLLLMIIYFSSDNNQSKATRYILIFLAVLIVALSRQVLLLLPFLMWFVYEIALKENLSERIKINSKKIYEFILLYRYFFAVFTILSVVFFLLLQSRFGYWLPANDQTIFYNLKDRFFLGSYALIFYLFIFLFPFNLNAIHPYPLKTSGILPLEYYFAFAGVVAILFIAIYILKTKEIRNKKAIIFSLIFFLVNIFLVLHIIPIQGRLVAADRYSYFGFIGLFAVVGFAADYLKHKMHRSLFLIVCVTCLLIFSFYSFIRTDVWKNSISLFSNVIKKNPDIAFAHSNLGVAKMSSGKYEEVIMHLNKAIELDSTLRMAYYNRAMANYQQGAYEKSLKDMLWLIRIQKDSSSQSISYNDVAMIKMETGDLSAAKIDIETSISFNQENPKAYNNSGRIKCMEGDLDGSIADFNKALSIMPDMDEAYANRGWSQALKGNPEKAMQDYVKAIEINPENEKAFANLGTMKVNMKDVKGGIADLSKAIDINPQFEIAYRNRGYAFFVANDLENCIRDYSKAILLNPKSFDLYQNRGWAYFRNNDMSRALKDYDKSIEINKQNDASFANRGWIKFKMHDSIAAIADLNKAIEINKKSEKGYFFRGIILYNKKKYKLSLMDLNEVIKINAQNAEAFYYSGMCKISLGRKIDACADLNEAKKFGYSKAGEALVKNCK